MIQSEIVGTFVFRNDGDGCLSSKYFHSKQPWPFVETAKRAPHESITPDPFDGNFKTTWIQENQQVEHAELNIARQPNNTYKLTWSNNKGVTLFTGIGMIYDGLLAGAYWGL